ncbi:hypothetical protein SK128_011263, partial [Halocaridina rubra]
MDTNNIETESIFPQTRNTRGTGALSAKSLKIYKNVSTLSLLQSPRRLLTYHSDGNEEFSELNDGNTFIASLSTPRIDKLAKIINENLVITPLNQNKNNKHNKLSDEDPLIKYLKVNRNTELTDINEENPFITSLGRKINNELPETESKSSRITSLNRNRNNKLAKLNKKDSSVTSLNTNRKGELSKIDAEHSRIRQLDTNRNTELLHNVKYKHRELIKSENVTDEIKFKGYKKEFDKLNYINISINTTGTLPLLPHRKSSHKPIQFKYYNENINNNTHTTIDNEGTKNSISTTGKQNTTWPDIDLGNTHDNHDEYFTILAPDISTNNNKINTHNTLERKENYLYDHNNAEPLRIDQRDKSNDYINLQRLEELKLNEENEHYLKIRLSESIAKSQNNETDENNVTSTRKTVENSTDFKYNDNNDFGHEDYDYYEEDTTESPAYDWSEDYYKYKNYPKHLLFQDFFQPGFVVENTALCKKGRRMFVFINSKSQNHFARLRIRETYIQKLVKHSLSYAFIVSIPDSKEKLEDLKRENERYRDLIVTADLESYASLTFKIGNLLYWAKKFCKHVDYIAKIDDDVYVRVDRLLEILEVKRHAKILGKNMDGEMKENETLREQIRSLEEANKAQGQERKELEKRIKKLEGEKSQLESRLSKQEDKNKQLNDKLKELD